MFNSFSFKLLWPRLLARKWRSCTALRNSISRAIGFVACDDNLQLVTGPLEGVSVAVECRQPSKAPSANFCRAPGWLVRQRLWQNALCQYKWGPKGLRIAWGGGNGWGLWGYFHLAAFWISNIMWKKTPRGLWRSNRNQWRKLWTCACNLPTVNCVRVSWR